MKKREVVKYYFCEYLILFLMWFKVFLVEANLFQVLLNCSQTELSERLLYVASIQRKKIKIEIEPKILLLLNNNSPCSVPHWCLSLSARILLFVVVTWPIRKSYMFRFFRPQSIWATYSKPTF